MSIRIPHQAGLDMIGGIKERCRLDDDVVLGVRASVDPSAHLIQKANTLDVVGMATTDDVDSEGDVVLPDGADRTYIDRNRKVFVDHWTGTDNLVGTIRSMKLVDKAGSRGWLVRVALIEACSYTPLISELAATVGIGFSIGFMPLEMGSPTAEEKAKYPGAERIIRRWSWYELSFTAFPCNVSCQTGGTSELEPEFRRRTLERLSVKHTPEARRMLRGRALVIPYNPLVIDED